MNTTRFTSLLMGALLAAAATLGASPDLQGRLDQISADAGKARAEALEIKTLLKAKAPDMAQVQQKLDTLRTHVDQLKVTTDALDPAQYQLTTAQAAELDKVRKTAEVLQVFVQNKADMLADGADRSLLRAKADGVARRAAVVEQSVARLRGN